MFLPNVIKIDTYNFELYRFKVGAFFLRHSVYCVIFIKYVQCNVHELFGSSLISTPMEPAFYERFGLGLMID